SAHRRARTSPLHPRGCVVTGELGADHAGRLQPQRPVELERSLEVVDREGDHADPRFHHCALVTGSAPPPPPPAAPTPSRAASPSALRGAKGARHSPPCAAAYASSCQGWGWRGPPPVCRSCTSSAAMRALEVEGSKISTPKRWAPAYAAARARFFTTDLV